MKKTRSLIDVARSRGSTATTSTGARRYLRLALANVESLPFPDVPGARRRYVPRGASRLERHDARLLARYRGAVRLPRYLTSHDRLVLAVDDTRSRVIAARDTPILARAVVCGPDVLAALRPTERREWLAAGGELVNHPLIARDAFARAPWRRLRKRYLGRSSRTAGIRTETNGKWGWHEVSWHYADYTYVVPRMRGAWWVEYYIDPCQMRHVVRRTRHYLRIDRDAPIRIADKTPVQVALPAHVQRRILAPHIPPVLRVDFDRAESSRGLMLVDGWGEQYHMQPVTAANARQQIRDAVSALRRRRAERLDEATIRRTAGTAWVTVDDSYVAGNCVSQTDQFAAEIYAALGVDGPCAVRGDVVLAHRDDTYTRRAVAAALAR